MHVIDARNPNSQPFNVENGLGQVLIRAGLIVPYNPPAKPVDEGFATGKAVVSFAVAAFMDGVPYINGTCSGCNARHTYNGRPEKAGQFFHCRRDDVPASVLEEYREAYDRFFKPRAVPKAIAEEIISAM